jgi:K+-transporting ATPase ATPase C chain
VISVRWFSALVRQTLTGLWMILAFTVLCGVAYPLAVYAVGHVPGLAYRAEGSIVRIDGKAVGSQEIGVDLKAANPRHDPWFHTRPSASALDSGNPTEPANALAPANPDTSGGTNYAEDNPNQIKLVQERKTMIANRENVPESAVPVDAVTASGSGLDPDISPAYAYLQAARVARVNGLPEREVRQLVTARIQGRGLGFVGEPVVNVLDLNMAVQRLVRH